MMIACDPEGPFRAAVFAYLDKQLTIKDDDDNTVPVVVTEQEIEGQKQPYVAIVECSGVDNRTKDGPGWIMELTLHTWSSYSGSAEVCAIADQIIRRLTDPNFSVPGFSRSTMHFGQWQTLRDPDGKSWHRVQAISCELHQRS
jgi:hypothetical protein